MLQLPSICFICIDATCNSLTLTLTLTCIPYWLLLFSYCRFIYPASDIYCRLQNRVLMCVQNRDFTFHLYSWPCLFFSLPPAFSLFLLLSLTAKPNGILFSEGRKGILSLTDNLLPVATIVAVDYKPNSGLTM